MAGFGGIKDEFAEGDIENFETEAAGLGGAATHGTVALNPANTWVQVPTTIPTSTYLLKVSKENEAGTIRWSLDNTTTPSATAGEKMWSDEGAVVLEAGNALYFASTDNGDDINWSTKIV